MYPATEDVMEAIEVSVMVADVIMDVSEDIIDVDARVIIDVADVL